MPNWVTTRILAPRRVIEGMLNSDGRVDFSVIRPFPGPNDGWSGIFGDAERAAEIVCSVPMSSNPLLRSLQEANRERFDIKKLSDESFSQFVGMVENYRACGYLHSMDFARQAWGTKWNACEQTVDLDQGNASFETAWSCPEPILIELSKRFPEDRIDVVFADEDIGSNCGRFSLLAGEMVDRVVSPGWGTLSPDEQKQWSEFAAEVKGWDLEEEEDA